MSQLLLNQIQGLLNNLSTDIQTMGDTSVDNFNKLMQAVDDVAGHVLALEGIVVALLANNQVDPAKVKAWIELRTQGQEGKSNAFDLAMHMINGKIPE